MCYKIYVVFSRRGEMDVQLIVAIMVITFAWIGLSLQERSDEKRRAKREKRKRRKARKGGIAS